MIAWYIMSYCSELYEVGVVMLSERGAQLIWGNHGGREIGMGME